MHRIEVFAGSMTSRKRVWKTFHFEKTDRVPIDYQANDGIHRRLSQALGIPSADEETLRRKLGVDFRMAWVNYKGPAVFEHKEGLRVDPIIGAYTKWVEHDTGGYWEAGCYPLMGAEPEIIAHYPVVDPDCFDYEETITNMKQWEDYAVYAGHAGICDIINTLSRLMGMEETLVNLIMQDEATIAYVDRLMEMELKMLEQLIVKSKRIDFLFMGEDLGTQIGPMISPELYREVLKPRHKKFVDLAKAYNLPVMIHSCGSSSWAFDDFMELGIRAIDTLQPEVANMSPQYLKDRFRKQLVFHGCISTAGPLAYGTAEEVTEEVRNTLEVMMEDGGYCLAPTHMIQDNSPVDNVIAMYQAAHQFGVY